MKNKKKNSFPNSACWNITSRCNDFCKFCYREKNAKELSFEEQKKVLDKVAGAGIKKITFAGGEPLLIPRINELILYAKEVGLLVSLTTNAILLEDNKAECEFLFENLDWLTFSLDGADDEIQSRMSRNNTHATRIKKLLSFAKEYSNRKCRIKINTVVSKVNKDYMSDLVDVIKSYSIERWKLFQFTAIRGNAIESQNIFSITKEEFKEVVELIETEVKEENIILSISDQSNIESAYFVIFPEGDIRISDASTDKVLGNILTDNIIDIWENGGYMKDLHEQRTKFINEK